MKIFYRLSFVENATEKRTIKLFKELAPCLKMQKALSQSDKFSEVKITAIHF